MLVLQKWARAVKGACSRTRNYDHAVYLLILICFYRDKDNQYIDVWPINFPNPSERDAFDTTSLFMMQLACIVNMVAKWSKLMLRVCVCGEARQGSFSLSSNESHSDKLKNLLKLLRIKAKLFPVPGWSQVIESNQTDSNAYFQR